MRCRTLLFVITLALAAPVMAQPFPERPIVLATGYAAGGSTDIAARILSERFAALLGPAARIVVDNRPGAAGTIAAEWLTRQPPDGHTLMVAETGAMAAAPAALVGSTRYDPVGDFTHLGIISQAPGVLVATASFPGATRPEAIEVMRRAAPDSLTYASSGFGGVLHLRGEMLAQALQTRFVHVPYRSGALMMQSILIGEAQFGVAAMASATGLLRDGKVRGIALVGSRRFALFPDIPTLAELGVPGFDDGGFFVLVAPAGMPAPLAARLNAALVGALADPVVRERLLQAGHDPVVGANGLEAARDYIAAQATAYRDVVAKTGVRLQP